MAKTAEQIKNDLIAFRKRRVVRDIMELLTIFICLFPYGVAINRLMIPHGIVGGGLTGLTEIIYFASGGVIPVWITTLALNSMLLVAAIWLLGWKFCVRTIWGVLGLTVWFRIIPIASTPMLTDPFMSCVVSGLFCGAALGITYLNNGSTGGTDIVAMIVNKYKHVSLGRVLFACDVLIISCAYFLPHIRSLEHPLEPLVMGLCFTFMCMLSVDTVMNNARQSVQFFIFSRRNAEDIADAISSQVHRGVTMLDGVGWYSQRPMKVVTVLVKKFEAKEVMDVIKAIDPNAFVSQTVVRGVYGKGFDTVLNKKEQARAREIELAYEEAESRPVEQPSVAGDTVARNSEAE